MKRISGLPWGALLLVGMVAATLTTAYVHYTLGGLLFLMNALGYLALALLLVLPVGPLQRLRPLVLLALAGYTAATIVGWAIMGPYFALAYYTKAVELGLIGLITLELLRTREQIVPAFRSLLAMPGGVSRRLLRRPAESLEV